MDKPDYIMFNGIEIIIFVPIDKGNSFFVLRKADNRYLEYTQEEFERITFKEISDGRV